MHSTCTSYIIIHLFILHIIYALVDGAINIRDPYICAVHEFEPMDRTLSSTGSCLCSENVAIGFKTSIEAYFLGKNSARMPELLEVSKLCHNFEQSIFSNILKIKNGSYIAMNPLVSLFCDINV